MRFSPLAAVLMLVACPDANIGADPPKRLETLLLLPEPRVLGTELSITPAGAKDTVLTPAREIDGVPGIETYTKENFRMLGLSKETFAARAATAADRLLTTFKPEVIKDDSGKVIYALYRSDRPVIASLLTAPSLPSVLRDIFGDEAWAAVPNRYSLFVFPAKPEAFQDFSPELTERFRNDAYAASSEVFAIKAGEKPRVVGSFAP